MNDERCHYIRPQISNHNDHPSTDGAKHSTRLNDTFHGRFPIFDSIFLQQIFLLQSFSVSLSYLRACTLTGLGIGIRLIQLLGYFCNSFCFQMTTRLYLSTSAETLSFVPRTSIPQTVSIVLNSHRYKSNAVIKEVKSVTPRPTRMKRGKRGWRLS